MSSSRAVAPPLAPKDGRVFAKKVLNGKAPEDIDPFAGIDVKVTHAGSGITLPALPVAMDLQTARATIERKIEEENQSIDVFEMIDAFPVEGAVAFQYAMQRKFGWTSAVPIPGFFGSSPPTTIDVEVGVNKRMNVLWGRFELPGVKGHVQCGVHGTGTGPRFLIQGNVRRGDFPLVKELAQLTRDIVTQESIYRGKPVRLLVDDGGDIDWHSGVSFVDLSNINTNELVFSQSTAVQIATSLWTPIEQTERCRHHNAPLKRGILMEGPYGTGKSLTSAVTAVKAVQHGWTFITINRVSGLNQALHFARKFQPCILFAEDIDRVVGGEDRTVEIDDVLNVIDGIESKGTEIMVVLTTNHIENISQAMLRPGRLDAIISITPPDAIAVRQLIRLYGGALVDPNDTLDQCSDDLAGNTPAVIRECVERAKLYAISRTTKDDEMAITDQDVFNAAQGMKAHMELLKPRPKPVVELSLSNMITEAVRLATLD